MRKIPNNFLAVLVRCLPLVLDNVDKERMKRSTRLLNAMRQLKIITPKLKKINDNEQSKSNNQP